MIPTVSIITLCNYKFKPAGTKSFGNQSAITLCKHFEYIQRERKVLEPSEVDLSTC